MAIKSKLMGAGIAGAAANEIAGAGDQGLTATGSTNVTALVVGSGLNALSTTAANTGVILANTLVPGDDIYIYNGGASTLTVYPPVTSPLSTIDNGTSLSVVTKKGVHLKCGASGVFLSHGST